MNRWTSRLQFLWEEDTPPRGETTTGRSRRGTEAPHEPAGIPRSIRQAARFTLIGVLATGLMTEIIGVRMVAPVDAAPSYVAQCIEANCKNLTGKARADCNRQCQQGAGGSSAQSVPASTTAAPSDPRSASVRSLAPPDPWWYRWFALSPDAASAHERTGL